MMVLYNQGRIRKLPKSVQDYMRRKFNLPAEYLGILRCLEKDGANGGQPGISISIFSPVRAQEYRLVIKSAEDLKRYPGMVLFKGRIDSRGGVAIDDRRGRTLGQRLPG
jgi:hypothetical protein